MSIASCGKSVPAEGYKVDTTANDHLGLYVMNVDMVVTKDKITEFNLEETYPVNVWARIDASNIEGLVKDEDYLEVKGVRQFDGTDAVTYFAKHVKIGNATYTGFVRPDDDGDNTYYINKGEPVRYKLDGAADTAVEADLLSVLRNRDVGNYQLGTVSGEYFRNVMDGNISILKSDLTASGINPFFPNNKKNRSENDANFKKLTEALHTYFSGKSLDYKMSVEDANFEKYYTTKLLDDGTFGYNPYYSKHDMTIEANKTEAEASWESLGVNSAVTNLNQIDQIFNLANETFASVEYESMK